MNTSVKALAPYLYLTNPLTGWTYANARKRRTAVDFAHEIKKLLTMHFPNAIKIRLVSDNLNTHVPASLYKAFPAKEARELLRRIEFHHTPKHGSWLNIAESELAALSTQCLGDLRIKSIEELNELIGAWECDRNNRQTGVNWQFTTEIARIKLKRLYPMPIFSH